MWKNGKEGNTEGRRIMEGKNGAKERGDAAGEGRGAAGTSSGKQSGRKQNNCGMA